ncbi:hypothetical protein ACJIZ3_024651 [Penstemon smallii]|uniref:Protein kinase domain-containing protein n=1 Tax=Penstemon smallii TaxID=265156 RepID=A0ABD3TTE6_9LAMI
MGTTGGSVLSHLLSSADNTATAAAGPNPKICVKELTTTILNHVRLGRIPKAISILFSSAVPLPFPLYAHLFKICAANKAIVETRKLESHLITFAPNPPVFLLNRAIESYGKCGCLEDAKELFDEMPNRDGGSWNALITGYSKHGRPEDALDLFSSMIGEGMFANEVTFASVLASCGARLELWLSRQVHGLIVKYGFVGNVILESSLVDVYGKCQVMSDARRVFDEIEKPNDVSWNVIVRRYLECGNGKEAVNMFSKLIRTKMMPMNFTVSNAIIACSSFGGIKEATQIHGFGIKTNVEEEEVVSSTLIGMYAKFGDLESARRIFDLPSSKNMISYTTMVSGYAMSGRMKEARELFDQMPERSVISWNVMLAGYTRFFQWEKALEFVILMRKNTKYIDHVTLGLILNMCAAIQDVELGKQVHGYVYRHGYFSNLSIGNALLDMYGKCGNLKRARVWFYEMSHLRDKVSWNALLTSYAHHEMSEEAMMIIWKMLGETKPSKFTFGTLLAACANIFALKLGKQIHAFMIRNGYDIDIVIYGALVDMYSKCRCIEYAIKIFNEADSKDLILWNSMIFGCSHNGVADKVFELFETMEKEGITPDHVTFKGLLQACTCEGRVELGRKYLEVMSDKYGLVPSVEHYVSMVELYGQYGFMEELEYFLKNIPIGPTVPILTKVFDFSRQYKWVKLGQWAEDQLNQLNPMVPFRSSTSTSTTHLMPGRIVIAYDATKDRNVYESKDIIYNIRMRDDMIQEVDTITVLGVMHRALHPMGFQMQIGSDSFNGTHIRAIKEQVSRKVDACVGMLHHNAEECGDHGVAIEVKFVVGAPMKNVVVHEVAASNATWVVLDRQLRKELRFYHKHIPCKLALVLDNLSLDILRPYYSEKATVNIEPKLLYSVSKIVPLLPSHYNENNEKSFISPIHQASTSPRLESSVASKSKEQSLLMDFDTPSEIVHEVKKGLDSIGYSEIKMATNDFSSGNVLGEGGYGVEYRGQLKHGQLITVKVQNDANAQAFAQIHSEVHDLRFACHKNIVMFLGYFCKENLSILVYEYICNKSLEWHLFDNTQDVLEWHQRHAIAIGTAKGLRFLHEECRGSPIIHRDLRPSNILLTHEFVPLLGDCGIAKWMTNKCDIQTKKSGNLAYFAPEFAENGICSVKTDVFAFGIVLIQLISGRKAVDSTRDNLKCTLGQWALPLIQTLTLDELVDPRLGDSYSTYELYLMAKAAYLCVQNKPTMRPTMREVLRLLEGRNDHLRHLTEKFIPHHHIL